MDKTQLRLECLRLATGYIQARENNPSAKKVVETAETFRKFLVNEKAN